MIAVTGPCSILYFMAGPRGPAWNEFTRRFLERRGCSVLKSSSCAMHARIRCGDVWRGTPAGDVMLHLRSRYVSKAAILTITVIHTGRKSKSRLNSKGLDRRRRIVG